jgi:hypothetical protein
MKISENLVSWCGTAFTNPSREVELLDWLGGHEHKVEVLMYRKGLCDKRSLPCITPGGVFGPTKQIDDFKWGSGILFIDIDGKDNDVAYCREVFEASIYTLALSASSSGKGLSVFMRVPKKMTVELYRNYYIQMEEYLKQYGIVADPSGKNINRLRYASYDPNLVMNLNAQELPLWYKPKKVKKETIQVDSEFQKQILEIVEAIERSEWDISKAYNDWIYLAGFFYNVYGETQGLNMFLRLSRFYPDYDERKAIKKYEQCKTFENIRLNKFFKLIKPYESTDSKKGKGSSGTVRKAGKAGTAKHNVNPTRKSIQ